MTFSNTFISHINLQLSNIEEENLKKRSQEIIFDTTIEDILQDSVEISKDNIKITSSLQIWIDNTYETAGTLNLQNILLENFQDILLQFFNLKKEILHCIDTNTIFHILSNIKKVFEIYNDGIYRYLDNLLLFILSIKNLKQDEYILSQSITFPISTITISWILEITYLILNLALRNNDIKMYKFYLLCFAPQISWLLCHIIDSSGNHFINGIEITLNIVNNKSFVIMNNQYLLDLILHIENDTFTDFYKNELLLKKDKKYDKLLTSDFSLLDINNGHLHRIILPISLNVDFDKDTLDSLLPKCILLSVYMKEIITGETIINCVKNESTYSLNPYTGEILFNSEISNTTWEYLCSYYLWPFISNIIINKPSWCLNRKKCFIMASIYVFGGNIQLARFVKNKIWWEYLPFIKNTCLFKEMRLYNLSYKNYIKIPLSENILDETSQYIITDEFTFVPPHPLFLNTESMIILCCCKKYHSCALWLLSEMYKCNTFKATAIKLHPLLNSKNYTWKKLSEDDNNKSIEETAFQLISQMVPIGINKIKKVIKEYII